MGDRGIMFKTGDIGFVISNDSKMSKLIAWFMKSKWSHSFVVVESTFEDDYIVETNNICVVMDTIKQHVLNHKKTVEVWRPIDLSVWDEFIIKNNALRLIGTMYGYLRFIFAALRRLLMRVNLKIPNIIPGTLCDDVIYDAYEGTDYKVIHETKRVIDTQELYEVIINSGRFQRIL